MKSKIFSLFAISCTLIACNDKKLTEIVEVPLPKKEDKIVLGKPEDVKTESGPFQIEKLPFGYDDLAPEISSTTLNLHYSKHYLAFANNLNKLIVGTGLENSPIEEVLTKLDVNNYALKNNAGGYYNHSLFIKNLSAKKEMQPKDTLASAINKRFGSYDNFKRNFKLEAEKQFGSSWLWLIVDKKGELQITNTKDQDNPLMKNAVVPGKPILALDLWEHAYFIDYQYNRRKYVEAFFDVLDWNKVNENYKATFVKK